MLVDIEYWYERRVAFAQTHSKLWFSFVWYRCDYMRSYLHTFPCFCRRFVMFFNIFLLHMSNIQSLWILYLSLIYRPSISNDCAIAFNCAGNVLMVIFILCACPLLQSVFLYNLYDKISTVFCHLIMHFTTSACLHLFLWPRHWQAEHYIVLSLPHYFVQHSSVPLISNNIKHWSNHFRTARFVEPGEVCKQKK